MTTDLMMVRLNLGEDPDDQSTHVLSDTALTTWLEHFDHNTDLVTHRALITIAMSEALIAKKIQSQHLSTDGPALSAELRALAETYKQASDEANESQYFAGYVSPVPSGRLEAEEHRWPS
jgi:hypothetical protein